MERLNFAFQLQGKIAAVEPEDRNFELQTPVKQKEAKDLDPTSPKKKKLKNLAEYEIFIRYPLMITNSLPFDLNFKLTRMEMNMLQESDSLSVISLSRLGSFFLTKVTTCMIASSRSLRSSNMRVMHTSYRKRRFATSTQTITLY